MEYEAKRTTGSNLQFQHELAAYATLAVERAIKCRNEEQTKNSLILPFLHLLGYDIHNPDEVIVEYGADVVEKYKNRVDYAICIQDEVAIAIEVKTVGTPLEKEKGQLKRYFNSEEPFELGILTDGIIYQLFTYDASNRGMGNTPYCVINLQDIAHNAPYDINTILALTKAAFNREHVKQTALKQLLLQAYIKALETWLSHPDDGLIRLLMDKANVENDRKRNKTLIDKNRALVREALQLFLEQQAPKRHGHYIHAQASLHSSESHEDFEGSSPPTENALALFHYVKQRLLSQLQGSIHAQEVAHIGYKSYVQNFRVYYKNVNKGSLFALKETKEGNFCIFFALENKTITLTDFKAIDTLLLESFQKRLSEVL